jgi:hypothetical protein
MMFQKLVQFASSDKEAPNPVHRLAEAEMGNLLRHVPQNKLSPRAVTGNGY